MTRQIKFIFYITVITEAAILNISQNESLLMIECIVEMIKVNEKTIRKASVHFPANDSSLLSGILKDLYIPFVINSYEWSQNEMKSDLVLILNSDLDITQILNSTRWDSSTNFLMIHTSTQTLEEIFSKFWNKNITNIFALVEESDHVNMYGLEPYQAPDCGVKILLLNTFTNGQFLNKIFWDKQILNMNNCLVNITIFDDVKPSVFFEDKCDCGESDTIDGIEGKIMIEISKKMSFKAKYLTPANENAWGRIYPHPAGVVGDVYTGRSEIGFGLVGPTVERFEHLDLSISHGPQECLTIGVPKGAGPHDPNWIKILIFEFSPFTWGLMFLMSIFTFFMLWKFKKITTKNKTFTKSQLASYIFTGFLAMSTRIPIEYGSTFKTIFISYIWYSYILTVAYQSSLGSELTVPNPYPEIDTLQELVNSGFKITGHKNLIKMLEDEEHEEVLKNMFKQSEVTNIDIDVALESIAHNKHAHIRQRSNFLYYLRRNRNVRRHVHVIKECIMAYFPVIILRRNSPLTKRVNQVISMLFETGITDFWREQYKQRVKRWREQFVRLSIDHLYGAIFILGVGWILALICFVVEICCNYLRLMRKK